MKIKRFVALMLSLSMSASIFSFNALAEEVENVPENAETEAVQEEMAPYAEIVFDDEVTTTNIKNWYYISGGSIEEFKGKKAAVFAQIAVDVEDSFLYDVAEGDEIWITIDYYGHSDVNANIHYETFNPTEMYTTSKGYVKHAQHKITATEEWEAYTYKLTDYKGANGVEGNLDFRLANWIHMAGTEGKSGKMAVHSVRIERRPWKSPLRMDGIRATMDKFGNMYDSDDEMLVTIPMKNASEVSDIKVDWKLNIYNANDMLVDTVDYSCELAPGEVRADTVAIPNPVKKGVYVLRPVSKTSVKENGAWGEPVADDAWEKTDFSVSFIFDKDSLNYNVGINTHAIGGHYNSAKLMQNVGVGWNRTGEGRVPDRIIDGEYFLKDEKYDELKYYNDLGIKNQWEIRPTIYEDAHYMGAMTYKRPYVRGEYPSNASELAHFVGVHSDFTAQVKDVIQDFEIFNEPDIAEPAPGGKWTGEMTKATASAIRKSAPGITISGPTSAEHKTYFHGPFAEAGALDSIDIYNYHDYDWSGDFGVWEFAYLRPMTAKNYLRQHGKDDMPIWMTETGFIQQDMRQNGNKTGQKGWYSNLYPDGMPRHVAARLLTLETAAFAGFDIVDKWFWHVCFDFADATEREDSFGIFNTHLETSTHDYTPYTAKPIAVALAATNHFITDDTITKNIYGRDNPDEGVWGFHFYNPELAKDVFVLQSQEGMGVEKAFDLGCQEVDIYDIYGNHMGKMKSDDGIFTFHVTQEGFYIVGSFTRFTETVKAPVVSAVEIVSEGINSDIVTAVIKNNTQNNYAVEVENLEVVSISQPDKHGNINISYKLPAWDYKRVYGLVKVKDRDGNLVFIAPLEAELKDAVSVTWEPIKLSENIDTRWGIKATVHNHAQTIPISGEVSIQAPDFVASINEVRRFDNLGARKTLSFIFKLDEMIEKEFIDLESMVQLDTGFKVKYEEAIDFTTAKYAYKKPVIDGVQSPGEWNASKIGVKNPNKFSNQTKKLIEKQWSGPEDFSYSMQLMWDEEYFYFLGTVVDDIQYNAASKNVNGQWGLWEGDSIQIAMSDEEELNSMITGQFAEIGLGLETEVNEVWTFVWNMRYEKERSQAPLQHSEAAVVHYDGYTTYELKVPWSELFYEGYVLDPSKKFRIAVLGNENDGDQRMALEYGNGVADDKDASKFARIQFVK